MHYGWGQTYNLGHKSGVRCISCGTNSAMTLFTSFGPSDDCRGLTQVTKYQGQTNNARAAIFSVSQRGFSLGWGLQGKVVRTPHQSKGSDGTVWCGARAYGAGCANSPQG